MTKDQITTVSSYSLQGRIQITLRGGALGAIEADKKQEKITHINNLVSNVYMEFPV